MTVAELCDQLVAMLLEGTVTRETPVVLTTDLAESRCHPAKDAAVGGYSEWGYPWKGGEFFLVDTEGMETAVCLRPDN